MTHFTEKNIQVFFANSVVLVKWYLYIVRSTYLTLLVILFFKLHVLYSCVYILVNGKNFRRTQV